MTAAAATLSAPGSAWDRFAPRRAGGTREGLALAVVAHVLLVLALAWSVNWHASEPEGVVAELWSALPQTAAPRASPPEPTPPTPVPPTPTPTVVPPKPRVEPRPEPRAEPPRVDPQIAIERAARERAVRDEAARREAARQEEAKREKLAEAEQKKKELEQKRQDEARLAASREANLKRMMAQAGGSDTATPATGRATQTSGPSAGYAGRIKARIKPNIVLTGSVDGNPTAEVEVRVAPEGTIVGRRILKSSGSPVWDETVLRAIDKTEVLPRDTDGRIPPTMLLTFRPNE